MAEADDANFDIINNRGESAEEERQRLDQDDAAALEPNDRDQNVAGMIYGTGTASPEGGRVYASAVRRIAAYRVEIEQSAREQAEKELDAAHEALRSIASWLGVGGYNAETVDPDLFERKIRAGVDDHIRVQSSLHFQRVSDDEEKALLRTTIRDREKERDALKAENVELYKEQVVQAEVYVQQLATERESGRLQGETAEYRAWEEACSVAGHSVHSDSRTHLLHKVWLQGRLAGRREMAQVTTGIATLLREGIGRHIGYTVSAGEWRAKAAHALALLEKE